jgi:hypothetical protein
MAAGRYQTIAAVFARHRGLPDDYFSVVHAKIMRMLTTEPEIDLTFATSAARVAQPTLA